MAIDIPTFVYKVNYNVKTFISLLMTSDKYTRRQCNVWRSNKKGGNIERFFSYLPTQSGDPHFLFELLNRYHVSYLLV